MIPKGKANGFKPLAEEWGYYSLDDGDILGIKTTKTNQFDATGLLVYVFHSTDVVQVLAQDEYKAIVKLQK